MYIDRMDFLAGMGESRGLEAGMEQVARVRKAAPGFLGQSLLRSFATPNKYTVIGRWEDIASAWAFSASDELISMLKGMPTDTNTQRTRFEGYESVFEVDADKLPPMEEATCEVFADWDLSSPGKAQAFEESRQELFDIQKKHVPGFISARLRRSSGIPTRYLMIMIYTSREASPVRGGVPGLGKFMAANPAANFANTPPQIEAYHVVHRL